MPSAVLPKRGRKFKKCKFWRFRHSIKSSNFRSRTGHGLRYSLQASKGHERVRLAYDSRRRTRQTSKTRCDHELESELNLAIEIDDAIAFAFGFIHAQTTLEYNTSIDLARLFLKLLT